MFDTFILVTISYAGIGFSVAYLVDGLLGYPQVWIWQENVQIRLMARLQLAGAKRLCREMPALAGDARFPERSLNRTRRKLVKLTRRAIVAEAEGRHITAYLLLNHASMAAARTQTRTLIARQAGWMGVFLIRCRNIAANRTPSETAATLSAASYIYCRTALDLYAVHDGAPDNVVDIDWRIRLAELCDDYPMVYRFHQDALAIEQKSRSRGIVKRRMRLMSNCARKLGKLALADRHYTDSIPLSPTFHAIRRKAEEIEYEADEAYRHGQFSRSLRLMQETEILIRQYLDMAEEEGPETAAQYREGYRLFKSKMSRYAPGTIPAAVDAERLYLAAAE